MVIVGLCMTPDAGHPLNFCRNAVSPYIVGVFPVREAHCFRHACSPNGGCRNDALLYYSGCYPDILRRPAPLHQSISCDDYDSAILRVDFVPYIGVVPFVVLDHFGEVTVAVQRAVLWA